VIFVCNSRVYFSDTGYPSGINYPPSTGMEAFVYPCNPTGKT